MGFRLNARALPNKKCAVMRKGYVDIADNDGWPFNTIK